VVKPPTDTWRRFLESTFVRITSQEGRAFENLKPSDIPEFGGVYLITMRSTPTEKPYYVGRTKNLRRRIYVNHLMGSLSNARLKKYLVETKECKNPSDAKDFIKEKCSVRWTREENIRKRGAIEGYMTGLLFPKHGISEEH
jgi:hypothetical protein